MAGKRTPQHQLDDLDLRRVIINLVKYDTTNARKHSKRNLDAIEASLRAFGQRKPLVVDQDMTVVAGNGTLSVMNDRLNWGTVWVSVFPGTMAEARAYAIADNRTGDLSAFDDDLLAESLLSISRVDETLLAATGHDLTELDALMTFPDHSLLAPEPSVTGHVEPESATANNDDPSEPADTGPPVAAPPVPTTDDERATRSLMIEFPAYLFPWLMESLTTYRTSHGLANTAEAFVGMVEQVTGTPAPDVPSGVIPG